MNRPLDHLTDALIDKYVKQSSWTVLDAQDAGVETHLSGCAPCLNRVLQAQRVHFGLLEADPVNKTPHPECPGEEVLQKLAAGICSPDDAPQVIQHAAHCDHCGPLLNQYLEEFSDEQRPEDADILNALKSAKPKWQKQLFRKYIASQFEQRPKRAFFIGWWPKMALAGGLAVLAVAIAGGPALLARFDRYRTEKLLAAAWSERRTVEIRLPSVPYAPFNPLPVERSEGAGQGLDYDRPALLKAKSDVASKLQSGKLDPYLLQLAGRVSLLEGTANGLAKAEDAFEKARSQGLNTPELQIDLAASYFELDSKADHPNLQKTLDLLEGVLKNPKLSAQDRCVALFNLALAYEKTQAWDMAVETWEQYLKADPSGPWADQAKLHLKDAKSKVPAPRQQGYKEPSFFLSHLSSVALQQEEEEYQDIALIQWLPEAVINPGSDSRRAIEKLANSLMDQHSDPWLRDLLVSLGSNDLPAIQALSAAVRANHEGLYDQALKQSRMAAGIFASRRNDPAGLRARLEEVYALRSMRLGANCFVQADSLWDKLSGTKYQWLQAQLSLEKAQCKNFQGNLTEANNDSKRSFNIARDSHYPVLMLRIIGISGGIKRQQGELGEAWQEAVKGLGLYWQGVYPNGERLDQFYAVMWQCARESGFLYAAAALLRHTIQMRESPDSDIRKNSIREAMLHLRLANILTAQERNNPAAEESNAQEEASKATSLLQQTHEAYSEDHLLTTKIELAELQLEWGDAQLALSTLMPAGEMVKRTQDNFFFLQFHKALGNINLKLKRLEAATAAYHLAIETAETSLYSLKEDGRRLQWIQATDESYRGLVRVFLDQGNSETALRLWEWYKSRPWLEGFVGKISAFSETSWAAIQAEISKPLQRSSSETRLVYASFKDGLQIWILNGKGTQSKWVEVRQEDFERDIRNFAKQCATPNSNLTEIQEQSRKLYTTVLQPVVSELPGSSAITIELDLAARELPIEALESPDGSYFGAKYSVVHSPGLLMEKNLRAPMLIGTQLSLLLVNAAQSRGTDYLPGVREEKDTIAQLFPHARIMDSADTSWVDLRRSLPQSEVFAFVGHGRPDGAGTDLMLNSREALKAKDFAPELLRRSRLAVLSGCSTGVGRDNGMLDTDNLVHAFLSAGVPSVIASRWNVDSENTAQLMSSFYRHLGKNETVAQSISEARKEMSSARKHPYYWASFNLSGRAN
jgi:CHAT domain-containing protein